MNKKIEINYKVKTEYLKDEVLPKVEQAFIRGDAKYHGQQHSHCPRIMKRSADMDIRHIRDCHCNTRLLEAEDLADGGDLKAALEKIESAIGYLVILHMRTKDKIKE